MPNIHLTTFIAAPVNIVFDLSRSIDLHILSTSQSKEKAIEGVTSGLINCGQTVTWEAKHLFRRRRFTSKISAMEFPVLFVDEMVKGDFLSFKHEHHFKKTNNGTIMIDMVRFQTPFGILGKWANWLFLKTYLENLIIKRNSMIRDYAETGKWKLILN